MKLVGADGVITVEEGKTADTEVKVVQGMQFDRGYLSPHFVTNPESVTCEFEDAYILIYEEKISTLKSVVPLLEWAHRERKHLLIIAEDIEGEALAGLVLNKLKGVLQGCAVKAPGTARPPQGHARRHRDPHRRQGWFSRTSVSKSTRSTQGEGSGPDRHQDARPRQEGKDRRREHAPSPKAGARRRRSRAARN